MNQEKMYLLYHSYEYGEENEHEETKLLGIYSSKEHASEAADRYYQLSGFNQYPRDCFYVADFEVDRDSWWNSGFVGSDEIDDDFERLTLCVDRWLGMEEQLPEQSWKDSEYYNILCDIFKVVYHLENVQELAEAIREIVGTRFDHKGRGAGDFLDLAEDIKGTLKL